MTDTVEEVKELIVVKRNGKKVEFDGSKIALAIKKGFDSIVSSDQEEKGIFQDPQKRKARARRTSYHRLSSR